MSSKRTAIERCLDAQAMVLMHAAVLSGRADAIASKRLNKWAKRRIARNLWRAGGNRSEYGVEELTMALRRTARQVTRMTNRQGGV